MNAHDWNMAHEVGTPVLAWPGTTDQDPLVTRTRSVAWALPSGAPVVMVDGHAGGIHLDHVRPDPTRQPAPPDLEFSSPPCSVCGKETDATGDGFDCYPCGLSWGTDGQRGAWDDPKGERCYAVARRYATIRPNDVERCCRPTGHHLEEGAGAAHVALDGLTEWSEYGREPRAVVDADGELVGTLDPDQVIA